MARKLFEHSQLPIQAGDNNQVMVASPGGIQVHQIVIKSSKRQVPAILPTQGAIGHNLAKRNYTLHLIERYTRVDKDQINYEAVIEDPILLAKPWTIRRTFMLREGVRVREYVCAENNLDPGRYQEYLKNPSLFMRSPEQAGPPR